MKRAPASSVGSRELKTRLGSYLRKVRGGATILVTDRGEPVAELRPIARGGTALDEKLARLAAMGLLAWSGKAERLGNVAPLRSTGRSISKALDEEREDRF